MMLAEMSTWSQEIQYGFAGFAFVLLSCLMGMITWLVRQLIGVIRENNKVISTNNELIDRIHNSVDDSKSVLVTLCSAVLSRPCLYFLDESIRSKVLTAIKQHEELVAKRAAEEHRKWTEGTVT